MATVLVELGVGPGVQTVALVLVQGSALPDKGEEFGKASPVGLVVIVLLGLATLLLVRSMTKRLRRLPASFDPPTDGDEAPADPAPGRSPSVEPAPADAAPGPPDGRPHDAGATRER